MRKVLYILGQLTDEDVVWLGSVGRREHLEAGTRLIPEGEPIDTLYFVLGGRLAVTTQGQPLTELKTGEIVGEMSFVDTNPPSATVTAVDDTQVLAVARTSLANRMEEDPGFAARFYKAVAVFLSQRLRFMQAAVQPGSVAPDELDPTVLDNVTLAGDRFTRLLDDGSGDFPRQP